MKRLGITGVVFIAALALCGFMATASAQAESGCYLISNPKAGGGLEGKEGAYEEETCKKPTPHLLEGKWILAEPLVKIEKNLYCAFIRLELPGGISGEDGYYQDSKCTKKNTKANASDYTEVIVPGAVPEFLPNSGKYTAKSGKGALQIKGGTEIKCTADTAVGTITGAKTTTVTIDFTGCTAFGLFTANSLGDAAGTILTTATGELCTLTYNPLLTVGLKLSPTGKVHIEVAGNLALVEGTLIGEMKPINSKKLGGFKLELTQKGGEQAIKECRGGSIETLKGSENEGAVKEAGEETTDEINYLTTEAEIMG